MLLCKSEAEWATEGEGKKKKKKKKELTCSDNLPGMSKGYVNHCCCPSQSPTAVSSWHSPVELPFSCVWLVLLLFPPVGWVLHSLSISWASHIRRTSGVRHQEWSLRGTTHLPPPAPTPLCLSLFIFQPLSSSLPKALFFLFPSAYPPLFPHPPLLLRLHQQLPRLLAKFEQVRSPLFGEATLHLLARSVLEWLAKPSQHPPACITASMQLMNTTEGMCQCPSPAFLFDKFHSQ